MPWRRVEFAIPVLERGSNTRPEAGMRTSYVCSTLFVVVVAVSSLAQEGMQQQPTAAQPQQTRSKVYTIAVTVQSRDPRVKAISPTLNNEAADEVERQNKNVRALITTGTKAEAAGQARHRNADYLITIDFQPSPTAAIAIGGQDQTRSQPEIYGSDRAKMQGDMHIAWTVDSLNGNRLKLHDSRTVQPAEYPLAGRRPTGGVVGWDWVSSIASRAVRDAVMNAMDKLKLKKGLGLEIDVKGTTGHESKQP